VQLERKRCFAARKRQKETGTLGPHPIRDKNGTVNVNAERKAILKEMIRLGLRG